MDLAGAGLGAASVVEDLGGAFRAGLVGAEGRHIRYRDLLAGSGHAGPAGRTVAVAGEGLRGEAEEADHASYPLDWTHR